MPSKIVLAPTIHCSDCKELIESEIKKLSNIDGVLADEKTKSVTVMWSEPQNWESIAARLTEIGYPSQPLNEIKRHVAIVLYDGFTALDAVGRKGTHEISIDDKPQYAVIIFKAHQSVERL